MNILAIETSCDETSAAIVKDGQEVLSNIISSQIEFHKKYGGIVPEVAARKHIEVISPIIKEALEAAKIKYKQLDAVAVTYGPGLVGSLIVGLCAAKAIAYGLNIPLIGVNHLEGHIYANFLRSQVQDSISQTNPRSQHPASIPASTPKAQFPFICLLASGGHTMLILVEGHGLYRTLGRTRDDAAGEAFDKVARFLGLGYPGGPVIDQLAKEGDSQAICFTRPMLNDGYDFSFSGLKTAVVNYVNNAGGADLPAGRQGILFSGGTRIADLVASFQQAIVDVLVEKAIRAAKEHHCQMIALAGGVAANSKLRADLKDQGEGLGLGIVIPPLEYCTDNAAMIGAAAFHKAPADLTLAPLANLRL